MGYFYERLEAHLKTLTPEIDFKELHYLSQIGTSEFWRWKVDKKHPTKNEIEKLASVEGLGLCKKTLQSWKVLEVYGEDVVLECLKSLPREKVLQALAKNEGL